MITTKVRFQRIVRVIVRFGMEQITFEVPAVAGDSGPTLMFQCVDRSSQPINLTGKIVDLYLRRSGASSRANISSACTITSAVAGEVTYVPVVGVLSQPGTYFADLTISDGVNSETAPEAMRIVVRASNK